MSKTTALLIIAVLFFSVQAFSQIPDGYMSAKFGMNVGDVKGVIFNEGKIFFGEKENSVVARGEFLGGQVVIIYDFTPLSQKLYKVTVVFCETGDYSRIKERLTGEYGPPVAKTDAVSFDHDLWFDVNPRVSILLERRNSQVSLTFVNEDYLSDAENEKAKMSTCMSVESHTF